MMTDVDNALKTGASTEASHSLEPSKFTEAVMEYLRPIIKKSAIKVITNAIEMVGIHTDRSIEILQYISKPIRLASQGKSRSEVLSAISEAKDKSDTYFNLALSMVSPHPSDESPIHPKTEVSVNGSMSPKAKESVYSQQVANIFDEDFDDD